MIERECDRATCLLHAYVVIVSVYVRLVSKISMLKISHFEYGPTKYFSYGMRGSTRRTVIVLFMTAQYDRTSANKSLGL